MGLLQKLKSVFGLNGAEPSSGRSAGDVDVTVEREPSTDDEDAVKGTDTATTDVETTAETESPVSEAEPETDLEPEPEPDLEADDESAVEEAEPETEPAVESDDEADSEPEAEVEADPESEPDDEPPAAEGSDDPVTELNGIGPAYGERLSNLDIETVGELAVADADEIEAETDLSAKRVSDWIEQATEY